MCETLFFERTKDFQTKGEERKIFLNAEIVFKFFTQRVLLLVRSYRTGIRYLILLPTNTRGSTAVAQKVLSNSRSGKSDLASLHPLSFTSARSTHRHLSSLQSFSQLWNPRSTWIARSDLFVAIPRSKSTWNQNRVTWNVCLGFTFELQENMRIKLGDNYFKYGRASFRKSRSLHFCCFKGISSVFDSAETWWFTFWKLLQTAEVCLIFEH